MIAGECVVFFSMFVGGMLAAAVAIFFLTLGRASKVARAIFDILSPLAAGVIFFFSLYDVSGGVFRIYALVAFLVGGVAFRAIYMKSLPTIKRILRRIIVPMKSLENKVKSRFDPYRKRWEARMDALRKKRAEERAARIERNRQRKEERERRHLEEREKREKARRLKAYRRRLRAETKKEGRPSAAATPIRQSH